MQGVRFERTNFYETGPLTSAFDPILPQLEFNA